MTQNSNVVPFPGPKQKETPIVSFNRRELGAILSMYGQLVAAGEWRDYALNMSHDAAVFSVFKRTGETPAYRIEKRPKNAAKQGAYTIFAGDGKILKRGQDLAIALRIFNRKLLRIAEDG